MFFLPFFYLFQYLLIFNCFNFIFLSRLIFIILWVIELLICIFTTRLLRYRSCRYIWWLSTRWRNFFIDFGHLFSETKVWQIFFFLIIWNWFISIHWIIIFLFFCGTQMFLRETKTSFFRRTSRSKYYRLGLNVRDF